MKVSAGELLESIGGKKVKVENAGACPVGCGALASPIPIERVSTMDAFRQKKSFQRVRRSLNVRREEIYH